VVQLQAVLLAVVLLLLVPLLVPLLGAPLLLPPPLHAMLGARYMEQRLLSAPMLIAEYHVASAGLSEIRSGGGLKYRAYYAARRVRQRKGLATRQCVKYAVGCEK
jgi:hypothetical protein